MEQNSKPLKMMKVRSRVLIVDDDKEFAALLAFNLEKTFGCKTTIATEPYMAMDHLMESRFDLVVLDWKLPSIRGPQALRIADHAMSFEGRMPLKLMDQKIPVIVLSAHRPQISGSLRNREFFKVQSVISKQQPLEGILDVMKPYLSVTTTAPTTTESSKVPVAG